MAQATTAARAGAGLATADRSIASNHRTSAAGSNVLFYGDEWICLTADNEYGFDVLAQKNGQYQSIISDPKLLMQAFRWHMLQDGLLKAGGANRIARPTASGVATGTVARTSTVAKAVTGTSNAQRRARSRRVPVTRVPAGVGAGETSGGT